MNRFANNQFGGNPNGSSFNPNDAFGDTDEYNSNNSPLYKLRLAELIAKIGNESTTMANLYNGSVIAVKMKTVIVTYIWSDQKQDFVVQRTKNMRNKKKHHMSDDCHEEEIEDEIESEMEDVS